MKPHKGKKKKKEKKKEKDILMVSDEIVIKLNVQIKRSFEYKNLCRRSTRKNH